MQTIILKNAFYVAGQEVLGMSLWKESGFGPKNFWNHCIILSAENIKL
jgi:hypothetical protein